METCKSCLHRWIKDPIFINYIKYFVKHLHASPDAKKLLIPEKHDVHLHPNVMDYAKEHGVILMTIPSHCSHCIQPSDISVWLTQELVQPIYGYVDGQQSWKNCQHLHHRWVGRKTFPLNFHTIKHPEGIWKVYPLSIQIVLIMKIFTLKYRQTECFLAMKLVANCKAHQRFQRHPYLHCHPLIQWFQ
jgi:hypothetical protein